MPGFDTLGVRLARSRRRLERERAAEKVEPLLVDRREDGPDGTAPAAMGAILLDATSAQVIAFPGSNRRIGD